MERNRIEKDLQEQKKFLEQQRQWSKKRASILDEIAANLHEMKEVAVYASEHELTIDEMEKLNHQLNYLKNMIHCLEKKLYDVVH
jgi:ubiquinone biosynthesis protein UbiJ